MGAAELWSQGEYELLARTLAPAHDELVWAVGPMVHERWLDVATGTGEVAIRAARENVHVTAVDIAPAMLEKARAAAAAEGLEIQLDRGDAEALPYGTFAFDAVVSAFGAQFAADHAQVAAELGRVCRPGGRLGLALWSRNAEAEELWARFQGAPPEGPTTVSWGDPEYVRGLLGEDFDLERVEQRSLPCEASSGEELFELLTRASPPVRWLYESLEPERRAEFHRAVVEFAESRRVGATIDAPRPWLLVVGTRR